MARVPLQVARMAGAPPRRRRPAGEQPPRLPEQDRPLPEPLPRPGLLEVARLSLGDLVRRAGLRRVRTRRPA